MAASFKAQINETKGGKIKIEIDKEDFENFCNVCGLFKKEFIEIMKRSEQDHKNGKITKRNSLTELINEWLKL